jgi:DedD protein
MTQRDSASPSFDPKHRIVGAVVIVALAVILLPLILKEREPSLAPGGDTGVPAPAAMNTPVGVNKVAVTVVTPPVQSQPKPAAPPAITAPAISAAVVGAAPRSAPESAPVAPAAHLSKPVVAPKPTLSAASKTTNGWVVQVGTFASTTNAARVQDRLRSMGQTVQAEAITLQGSNAVRVRVGPFSDRTAAVKAQDRIQKETGMKVVVLAYP